MITHSCIEIEPICLHSFYPRRVIDSSLVLKILFALRPMTHYKIARDYDKVRLLFFDCPQHIVKGLVPFRFRIRNIVIEKIGDTNKSPHRWWLNFFLGRQVNANSNKAASKQKHNYCKNKFVSFNLYHLSIKVIIILYSSNLLIVLALHPDHWIIGKLFTVFSRGQNFSVYRPICERNNFAFLKAFTFYSKCCLWNNTRPLDVCTKHHIILLIAF